jgi:hypothetical protein
VQGVHVKVEIADIGSIGIDLVINVVSDSIELAIGAADEPASKAWSRRGSGRCDNFLRGASECGGSEGTGSGN